MIANTHLVFNPKRGDVKTAQLMMLTGRVERQAEVAGSIDTSVVVGIDAPSSTMCSAWHALLSKSFVLLL